MSQEPQTFTSRDRNLLFGVLAVQNRFINPAELARAAGAWAANPEKDLGEVLVQMGHLSRERKDLIDHLLDAQVQDHQGDAREALDSLGGASAVQESFAASIRMTEQGRGVECSLGSFGGELASLSVRDGPSAGAALDDSGRITAEHPGRYTVKGEYGRGGIGKVMIAFDEHIGREVALKELLPEKGRSSAPSGISPSRFTAAVVRFLREARITGQLEHPGIVPVYEIARRKDGTIYYTMKLVRGDTLHQRIRAAKTLPDRLALLPHFLDLCQAMAYAHHQGVIHRDLKPQNVMVGEFGETVVLDWGLAKVRGLDDVRACELEKGLSLIKEAYAGETVDGTALGTPSYMSPEQAEGKVAEIDEKSDVWSLGAILYEILTGEPPFTGDLAYEVMGKVITDPVVPVRDQEPLAPPELCAIAEKCLNKDGSRRYKNADELADDVVRFESGGLVSAYEYSMMALAVKWLKRYWPVASTVAAALMVLLLFGAWDFKRVRNERNQALMNLAEASFQKGRQAEEASRWKEARLFYAKALALTGREDARMALYREALQSVRITNQKTFTQEKGNPLAAALAPDAQLLAAGNSEPTLTLWSTETGQALRSLTGHQNAVIAVAFSPDGKTLASGSRDQTIKLWDPASGNCRQTLTGHSDAVSTLAFSPDGSSLLSGAYDSTLKLWPASGNAPPRTLTGHQSYVSAVAFLPGGKQAISASGDKTLKIWDLAAGECIKTLAGHTAEVWAVSVSPDGKQALSADLAGYLRLWDLETGKTVKTLAGHQGPVYAAAISPSGQFALSAGQDKTLRLWSLQTGLCLNNVAAHQDEIFSLVFSKDGKSAATASQDQTAKLWKLEYLEPVRRFELGSRPAAFAPDGKSILSGDPGDLAPGTCEPVKCESRVMENEARTTWALAAEDDVIVEPVTGALALWSLASGGCEKRVCGQSSDLRAAAVSPNLETAAFRGESGAISVWSLATSHPRFTLLGHKDEVTSLAVSPDNKSLLSAAGDQSVRLWDLEAGKFIRAFHQDDWGQFPAVAFAPDGLAFTVTGDADDRLNFFRIDNGQSLRTILSDHASFKALAFAPDGKFILTGGCAEMENHKCVKGEVKLWNFEKGKCLKTLRGHDAEVAAVAFSPDGKFALSAGADSAIKLWSLDTGESLMTFQGQGEPSPLTFVAFSADGSSILSRRQDGTIVIWPANWTLFTAAAGPTGNALYQAAQQDSGLTLQGFEIKSLPNQQMAK